MSEKLKRLIARAGIAGACLAGLVACGGGSGGTDDLLAQQQREDSAASASVAGLLAFAGTMLAGSTADTNDPRPIDGITPPTSESDEPAAL